MTRSGADGEVLGAVDVTRGMRLHASADTELLQLYLSADQLGLTVDELRVATGTIQRSPLRHLVAEHVRAVSRVDVDGLPAAAQDGVGTATIELVRAMLIGTLRPQDRVGSTMGADALRACTKRYVRRHLRDPALSHLARRFREEYGLTPREWRRTAAGDR